MNREQQIAEMKKLTNVGQRIAERLVDAGIESPEQLKKVGAKEIYMQLFEKEGWSNLLCPCFLYALEGAITGERWNEIPDKKKEEFKAFSKSLRESFPVQQ